MNLANIRTALYTWAVAHSSGATVVWAEQDAPRPARPYVTLKLNGPFRDQGADEIRYTNVNGEFNICGHRRFTVAVSTFGNTETASQQLAERMQFALNYESIKNVFRTNGISVSDEGDLTNITAFLDTKWEYRYIFEMTIMAVASGTETSGWIQTAEINNETVGLG